MFPSGGFARRKILLNAIKKIFALCFKVFELLAVACMIVMVVVVFI